MTSLHRQRLGLCRTLVGSPYARSSVASPPGHLYVFVGPLPSPITRRSDSSPAFRLLFFLWHQIDHLPNSVAGFPTLAHAASILDISDSLSFCFCFFCFLRFDNGYLWVVSFIPIIPRCFRLFLIILSRLIVGFHSIRCFTHLVRFLGLLSRSSDYSDCLCFFGLLGLLASVLLVRFPYPLDSPFVALRRMRHPFLVGVQCLCINSRPLVRNKTGSCPFPSFLLVLSPFSRCSRSGPGLSSCGNQYLHKTPGKSVTGYTELMGSLCEKKGTEKSQVFPWLAPGVFPGTLGPTSGAGCPAPASLMGPASIDGALAAPRDADAATVGNLNSHLPIALP